MKEVFLPMEVGDGRLDGILELFHLVRGDPASTSDLCLNWSRVEQITPAGFAIMACFFDSVLEQKCKLKNVFVKKKFKSIPVVRNLLNCGKYKSLPKPEIHDVSSHDHMLCGREFSVDPYFMDRVEAGCGKVLSSKLSFSCRLIVNELMQNSVDHSGAERYYLYAGQWNQEFHVGVLDMGITIPARLEQKYTLENDVKYLELALKEGSSTRRGRTGGLGLHHTFETLKTSNGRLTIVSRNAQIRRYFKRRKVAKGKLKYALRGTWCFTRFPMRE